MAFEVTSAGLNIQTIAEIKAEAEQSYRSQYGNDVDVSPGSVFSKQIGTYVEREALIQQLVQRIVAGFSRDGAEGVDLDAITYLFGSVRNPATQSKSVSGRCTGTPATFIPNGSQVNQTTPGTTWTIVDGVDGAPPYGYTIGGGGDVTPVTIEAVDTGPLVFASGSAFTIATPVAGWDVFDVVSDIETYETGRDIDPDGLVRVRGAEEIFSNGNDISAIKANVLRVVGVTECQVFENRNCMFTSPEGIPPGEVFVQVTGGDELQICQAILDTIPPGTDTFGNIQHFLPDVEGNSREMNFSRPSLLRIHVEATIALSNAEGTPPANVLAVVSQAILDFGNANNGVGQDVLYQQFVGVVFTALKDIYTGKFALQQVDIRVGSGAPPPTLAAANIPISIFQRADYDSDDIIIYFT